MPLLFSPVDLSELRNFYPPRPRSAFLILQLGGKISPAEIEMANIAKEILTNQKFDIVTAATVRQTSDYLNKIVDLIRGCGFALAIFSDRTPARTLGNIFFEVGVAGILGKPVQLVLSGRHPRRAPAPSDFIRTEWISYSPGAENQLRVDLKAALASVEEAATYYRKVGEIALAAPEPDLELAFERFKQAVLIANDAAAIIAITEIRDRLADVARRKRGDIDDDMASHRTRLLQSVQEFLRLLP